MIRVYHFVLQSVSSILKVPAFTISPCLIHRWADLSDDEDDFGDGLIRGKY